MRHLLDLSDLVEKPDDFDDVESILTHAVTNRTGHVKKFVFLLGNLSLFRQFSMMLNYYRKLGDHNIFGFNSGRFDLPVLLPYIVNYATRMLIPVKALKRGNTYITLRLENLVFKGKFNSSHQ